MNCPLLSEQTTEVLLDYCAGRLDRAQALTVEWHMASCRRCAAFVAGQAEVWIALDNWKPEPVSAGFNRTLWRKIEEAEARPWYRKAADALRFGAWKPAFPLAAALVVITAGFVLDHSGNLPASRSAGNGVVVSTSEADQVEETLDDMQLLREFDAASKAM